MSENDAVIEAPVGAPRGKVCRNAKHFSFDGLAEGDEDLATAWRNQLAREGKPYFEGNSVRDLVFDSAQ